MEDLYFAIKLQFAVAAIISSFKDPVCVVLCSIWLYSNVLTIQQIYQSSQIVCPRSASKFSQFLHCSFKFPRHSCSLNRKQFFFRRLRHSWNFSTSLVELFCRKSSERLSFGLFAHIFKHFWTERVANSFFSANFKLISEKRL